MCWATVYSNQHDYPHACDDLCSYQEFESEYSGVFTETLTSVPSELEVNVPNINYFIEHCSKTLKKGGIMFVATINKTLKSYLEAIVGAEYILRWLPIGTHNWDNFVEPNKLKIIAKNKGLKNKDLIGVKFNPFTGKWKRSSDTSVNYISTFMKS